MQDHIRQLTTPGYLVNPTQQEAQHAAITVVTATTLVLAYASMIALYPSAVAPELAKTLGVSSSVVGLQVSLIFGGGVLSSLVGGALTRRLGPCRASQLSLALLVSGALLLTAPSLITFVSASLLAGLGYGLTNPAASMLLVRYTPASRRGLVFSIKQTGVPLGGVIAGASAPLIAVTFSWQAGLWVFAALGVSGIVLLHSRSSDWDTLREPNTRWLVTPFNGVALVWRHKSLRQLAVLSFMLAGIQLSISAFTVAMLVEELAFPLVMAGFVMAALQVCGVAGRIFWGWLGDRLGDRLLALGLIMSITAVGCGLLFSMTPDWPRSLIMLVLCVLGSASLGWNGIYMAEVARFSPPDRIADAAGGCLVVTYSGVLLGLPLVTLLHLWLSSYTAVFGILALVVLLAFVPLKTAYRQALPG